MTNYLELPVGAKSPEIINVVIEIPGDGVNKYEYDKTLNVFRLDRNLYSPVHYPGDYGFIPSTLGDDGDPLDVLVLVDTPVASPAASWKSAPSALLEMIDQGQGDEKVLCVGMPTTRATTTSTNYSRNLSHTSCKEITHFFCHLQRSRR